MNFEKLGTHLTGLIFMGFLLLFAYQGIVQQHLFYVSSRTNIRLDGYQAVLFGTAALVAAISLMPIFLSTKKENDEL